MMEVKTVGTFPAIKLNFPQNGWKWANFRPLHYYRDLKDKPSADKKKNIVFRSKILCNYSIEKFFNIATSFFLSPFASWEGIVISENCEMFELRSHFINTLSMIVRVSSLSLWGWLPHRLSKRQSLTTSTVLFRTTFTRTIILNLLMNGNFKSLY